MCIIVREVSIHAPAWGATDHHDLSMTTRYAFQSTRPNGVRRDAGKLGIQGKEFQSTRPHGARRRTFPLLVLSYSFQSTRPHGARPTKDGQWLIKNYVSIHAPAWGATHIFANQDIESGRVSIHAPAWGATKQETAE